MRVPKKLYDWYTEPKMWDAVSWLFFELVPRDRWDSDENVPPLVVFGFERVKRKHHFWVQRMDVADRFVSKGYCNQETAIADLTRLLLTIGEAEWNDLRDTWSPKISDAVKREIAWKVRSKAEECYAS